ncbi:MAG: hypothetical protein KVP17_000141 [Porospora cf. gigantea B]|nr:MAG: hypothetical protein KVP17_000141 [Porospora cf. gigantea B]
MTASLWSVAARVPGSDIFNPLPASLVKQTYERPDHLAFVWTAVRRKELVVSEEFSYGVALRRVRAVARQLSTG